MRTLLVQTSLDPCSSFDHHHRPVSPSSSLRRHRPFPSLQRQHPPLLLHVTSSNSPSISVKVYGNKLYSISFTLAISSTTHKRDWSEIPSLLFYKIHLRTEEYNSVLRTYILLSLINTVMFVVHLSSVFSKPFNPNLCFYFCHMSYIQELDWGKWSILKWSKDVLYLYGLE